MILHVLSFVRKVSCSMVCLFNPHSMFSIRFVMSHCSMHCVSEYICLKYHTSEVWLIARLKRHAPAVDSSSTEPRTPAAIRMPWREGGGDCWIWLNIGNIGIQDHPRIQLDWGKSTCPVLVRRSGDSCSFYVRKNQPQVVWFFMTFLMKIYHNISFTEMWDILIPILWSNSDLSDHPLAWYRMVQS